VRMNVQEQVQRCLICTLLLSSCHGSRRITTQPSKEALQDASRVVLCLTSKLYTPIIAGRAGSTDQ
jgi:hypothetical protein